MDSTQTPWSPHGLTGLHKDGDGVVDGGRTVGKVSGKVVIVVVVVTGTVLVGRAVGKVVVGIVIDAR